jgi:dimethylaniline monooxygenase (N-oxide forming)
MKIAVVGAGISGVAAARTLQRAGHEVVVYEGSAAVGGVWTLSYPGVRLQNVAEHYRLGEFPWPFTPDLHPTGAQILRYLEAAVLRFALDVRLNHRVVAMHEQADGWQLELDAPDGPLRERFDWVVLAVGHYAQDQLRASWPGQERFAGRVIGDREVRDLETLAGKRVVVVGFGKSAVDMAGFAAERGSQVHHVFRPPRWLLPREMLGVHARHLLFSRVSTAFIPAWVHPSAAERLLHTRLRPLVGGFWWMISTLVRLVSGTHGLWRDPGVRARMQRLIPEEPLTFHMRSAVAMAPDNYFPMVVQGRIEPVRGEVAGLDESGVVLTDGRRIACDLVVASLGCPSPRFPYMPAPHRELLEREADGVQLYRHLIHPRVPRVAFAGFNHGFLHVPGVEVSMLWLAAHLRGDLRLPTVEVMERCAAAVQAWKREHTLFEPSRSCAINTRFHQHLDVLLGDLGVRPYRKGNPIAELLAGYTAGDYAGVFAEYERERVGRAPREPLTHIN